MRIGVDVGGTHTDVVVVSGKKLVYSNKVLTTENLIEGILTGLEQAILAIDELPKQAASITIGTTYCLNAVLTGKALSSVGVLRIDSGALSGVEAGLGWGSHLSSLISGSESLPGGNECDGRVLAPLNLSEVKKSAEKLVRQGVKGFAVSAPFSNSYPEQENQVEALLNENFPNMPVSLSSAYGGAGIIARENAAVLNSALSESFESLFSKLNQATKLQGLECPLWLAKNNGTRLSLSEGLKSPVQTLSCGPTNSFMGAMQLSGLDNAFIADIGGTSTDIGVVKEGRVLMRQRSSQVAGVMLNEAMPDLSALALGGGSCITDYQRQRESVGHRLKQAAYCFGGSTLTLTDAAVKVGRLQVGDASKVPLSREAAIAILRAAANDILACLESRPLYQDYPLVLVGGGAKLFRAEDFGGRLCLIPEEGQSANAYGAAIAPISATLDEIVDLTNQQKVISQAEVKLQNMLVAQGAQLEQIRVLESRLLPFHYMPVPMGRLQLTLTATL